MLLPRVLCYLLGLGVLGACHRPGWSQKPAPTPRLRPVVTLLGDSMPRPWLGTDTAHLDYCHARNDFKGVRGCVQLYAQGDSLVARCYAYTDTVSDVSISLAGLRAYYAGRRHRWRLLRRVTAPRARVLARLNAAMAEWPVFCSVNVWTAVDTYLWTGTGHPGTTLLIDHSRDLHADQRLLAVFQP